MNKRKIYCAGPLFNEKEKEEMLEIANVLEENDFNIFLPQRDGLEFAHLSVVFRELGKSEKDTKNILNRAIFALDIFQIIHCHGLILNMNGRVPDEGAMVEAGIAWSVGKIIVIYKDDVRTLFEGNDNPLVVGLSDFITLNKISEIPKAFKRLFSQDYSSGKNAIDDSRIKDIYNKGSKIFSIAKNGKEKREICKMLINILEDKDIEEGLRKVSLH